MFTYCSKVRKASSRDFGLEEAERAQALGLDGGVLVDHILLEPAADAGGLNLKREGERVHDLFAAAAQFVILLGLSPCGPLDLRVADARRP